MIEPVLHRIRLLAHILLLLALTDRRSFLVQSFLLFGFCFRLVFGEQFEGLRGSVAVQGRGELVDRGWDFQAEMQDLALALEAHVLGPFYHAREVAAGLDVLADAEVAGTFFDERVLRIDSKVRTYPDKDEEGNTEEEERV